MRRAAFVALVLFLALMAAPFLVMALTALKPDGELATQPLLPAHWAWGNLMAPWHDRLPTYLGNSLIVGVGATLLNLALALPAGYALARLPVRGRGAWRQALIATQMFAPVAVAVSLYRIAATVHLTDNLGGVILVDTAYSLAFAVWMISAYLGAVPAEIEEAALVDGCTRLGALRRVLLPAARPGIFTTVAFVFIGAWNEFVVAFTFLSSSSNKPLTVGLYDYASAYAPQWNLLMAASLWAIVPVIVLFALIERHLVAGLTAGAVK